MSKPLKLYIVVQISKGRTMISVNRSLVFQKIMPSDYTIRKHLELQSQQMSLGLPFSSLKISLSKESFKPLREELSRKCGGTYVPKIIDIVSELNLLPLIQIVERNE